MVGEAPSETTSYEVERTTTVRRRVALRPAAAGEVVVEVAGSALGAEPGAAIAGRVVAAGDAAAEWLGRRVVVPRVLPCGECDRCRRGRPFACAARHVHGAVSEHATVPARYLLSVEPPLWPAATELWQMAALADAVPSVYGALVRAQLGPGDLCVVVGAGVRGRIAIQVARAMGAEPVAIDADPHRRELARAAGARLVLDGASLDGAAARAALVAEAAAGGLRALEWKVIETTLGAAGRQRALALLGVGDTAALLAGGDDGDALAPLAAIAAHEATVVGAAACHPDLYPEIAARVVRGDLPLAPLVAPFPFGELADVIARVRRGEIDALPILVPTA